jgi:hypothetical protein
MSATITLVSIAEALAEVFMRITSNQYQNMKV